MKPVSSTRSWFVARLALLVALALVLGLVQASAISAEPAAATFRVVGPASPVAQGQQFSVTIMAESVQNLGAFEFQYKFNSSVASTDASKFQLSGFLGSTGRTTGQLRLDGSGGPLYGAYSYGKPAGPSGSQAVATVTMTAAGAGSSSLQLADLVVTDILGNKLPASAVSGSVQVVAGPQQWYQYLLQVLRNWAG